MEEYDEFIIATYVPGCEAKFLTDSFFDQNEKEENKTNQRISYLIMLCIGILAFAYILYKSHFSGPWSESQDVWGQFGDFINPFLTLINIIVFIYLTYLFSTNEEQKGIIERNVQKTIALNDLRFGVLKNAAKDLNTINNIIGRKVTPDYFTDALDTIDGIKNSFRYFLEENEELLVEGFKRPNFQEWYYDPLLNTINKISDLLEESEKLNIEFKLLSAHIIQTRGKERYNFLITTTDALIRSGAFSVHVTLNIPDSNEQEIRLVELYIQVNIKAQDLSILAQKYGIYKSNFIRFFNRFISAEMSPEKIDDDRIF